MQEAQHPNKLRMLLAIAGLTQRETSRESGIPEGTLRHYVTGEQIIPRRDRLKLAQVIGCDLQDLAPQYGLQSNISKRETKQRMINSDTGKDPSPIDERDGCFSFGKLKTAWKVLDGNGIEVYLPQHIRSRYIPLAEELPAELQAKRDQIQREQEQKREQGLPFFWNGAIYSLDRFVIGREPANEEITLDLWFRPSDYYTYLATNMTLNNPDVRQKYLQGVDWYGTVPYFSHSFGISLAVITSDGYTVFTQRGKNVGSLPEVYETGVVEGLSRPVDRSTNGEAPDVYRCACRGLAEELGLYEASDFSVSDITFLSFGVNTRYALRGLTGMVKVKRSREKILALWDNGVRDKFENQELFAVPFTPQDVISFAYSHQPFAPGPTLYYALIHEFGRSAVEEAFDSILV